MKKTLEILQSAPTMADMILSFVTMHLNNEDRFGTATNGLCENYLTAAPGAFAHPKSNDLKYVCTAALGMDEGPRLASAITSARSSNKKSINAAWKLRMKDMPYDMVKWISNDGGDTATAAERRGGEDGEDGGKVSAKAGRSLPRGRYLKPLF